MKKSSLRQEDRLSYEQIMQYKEDKKELCGYIRNPEKSLVGKCILSGLECREIFTNHRDCPVCLLYFLENYQIELTRRE